jgi:uncharacterized membrane protein
MKSLIELDLLRGVLLLMMVVNHSPSSLRRFTDQPLGFFMTATRERRDWLRAKIAPCTSWYSAFWSGVGAVRR